VRSTVTVAVSASPPASVTCTVSAKLGVVSKSSAAALATVIAPVFGSIAKAPLALPPVIAYTRASPASGSVATTAPTSVPFALFSGSEKLASARLGASFTFVRSTVTSPCP
jgi:hypothetical protein